MFIFGTLQCGEFEYKSANNPQIDDTKLTLSVNC